VRHHLIQVITRPRHGFRLLVKFFDRDVEWIPLIVHQIPLKDVDDAIFGAPVIPRCALRPLLELRPSQLYGSRKTLQQMVRPHTRTVWFQPTATNLGKLRAYACSGRRVVGQKAKWNSLTEHSLLWALGVILLLWIFAALRACGISELLRKLYS
jgi:hypothetical protein